MKIIIFDYFLIFPALFLHEIVIDQVIVCEIIKQAKELAATKALVWPLFYTGVFYLIFVGILTIVLGKVEKKLSYFRS